MRNSLATLEALGFPAIALGTETAELLGINAAASRLLGAPPEQPRDAWLEGVHPSDRAKLAEACRTNAARAELRATHDHLKFRRFQLELRPRGDFTLGILVEVIGQSSSEPELAALIEALPFEVWERDADGVLIRQNAMSLRNWHAPLGSTVDEMGMPPETAVAWKAMNARVLRGEIVSSPSDYEINGRQVHYINLLAPVRDAERICGIVGVNIDISAMRAMEEELARAQSKLVKRERLAALGELAAVVAHEVRNPLAAIYNSISALKRKLTLDRDASILFRILEEEAARLNRTVGDLLSYVRPLEPERRADDVVELARDVVRQHVAGDGEPPIRAEVRSPRSMPVNADPVLLRVALSNLVTNAVQSMPNGGELTVTVSEVSHEDKGAVAIAVHDTGKGIPAEVLPRVFEPFFTTRASGAGLGLAVVRRIVEAHDGHVTAESDEKHGTVFTVVLPH